MIDETSASRPTPAVDATRGSAHGLVAAYFRFVLRHRALVVLGIAAITASALWSASHAIIASSLEKMFFGDSPAYARYVERVGEFGTEEVNVFAFDEPDPLAPEPLARL